MDELKQLLQKGNIALYGYTGKKFPDFVYEKKKGTTRSYTKGTRRPSTDTKKVHSARYGSLVEMREKQTDVYFLDNEAVKVLFARFPVTSRYLLVRLIPRASWLIAIPGLLRRIFIGLVRIKGVTKLTVGSKTERWLVIEHLLSESLQTRYSISLDVGIQGLIDYLNNKEIRYVVVRFYDKLPELHREGGDLDILVSDEDESKIRSFLQKHPGTLGVDVYTPSRISHNSITYYPPPLARRIIASAIDGPAGARIPSPKEAFIGFAYHCLYHKGLFAGVPSIIDGIEVNTHPENNYSEVLQNMAEAAGIEVEMNMEALDEYLAEEGWRPKTDTLAKIAPWNTWVEKRFFSTAGAQEVGLGVFILKKKAFLDGVADDIQETLGRQEGYTILYTKIFTDDEVRHVTDHLRGGVWNDVSGSVNEFLPAMAVVVLDTHMARRARVGHKHARPDKSITDMKKVLRKKFDTAKVSSVHSTDTTHEAWEYIDECFPHKKREIENKLTDALKEVQVSRGEQLLLRLRAIPHTLYFHYARFKRHFLGRLVEWLVG